MKTRVIQIMVVAVFAILLISGNVNATKKEAIVVSGLENITETKLELENWMIDCMYWVAIQNVQDIEESLVIEAWMIEHEIWDLPTCEEYVVEADKRLELENWMTNTQFWN